MSTEPTVAALATIEEAPGALVRPAASLQDVVTAFQEYQALKKKLLTDDDFQQIGQKRFPKKSAWRKMAVAFGVSLRIKQSEVIEEEGTVLRARFIVEAEAPNGRVVEGWGGCDLKEKCCPKASGDACSRGHKHCEPNCTGTIHFSHPNHDIPATASTRAANRAASDLFGMGEISAEEVLDSEPSQSQPRQQQAAPKKAQPQQSRQQSRQLTGPATEPQIKALNAIASDLGWSDEKRHKEAGVESFKELTTREDGKQRASDLIDSWQNLEPEEAEEASETCGVVGEGGWPCTWSKNHASKHHSWEACGESIEDGVVCALRAGHGGEKHSPVAA